MEAFHYLNGLFSFNSFSMHFFYKNAKYALLSLLSIIAVIFLVFVEWNNVKNNNKEIQLSKILVFVVLFMLFFMGAFKNQMSFIYFQF